MATLRCRPSESEKEPVLVFMSATQMLNLKLKNGSVCRITNKDQEANAVSWLTTKADLKDGVIGVSKWLQDRCDIKLGNEIMVSKISDEVGDNRPTISLRPLDVLDMERKLLWELNAAVTISENYKYLAPFQKVGITVGRQKKDFEITGHADDIYRAATVTQIRITSELEEMSAKIEFGNIGGLQVQKHKLQQIMRRVNSPTKKRGGPRHSLSSHAMGVLLYGPAGTGKTILRRAVEAAHDWTDIVTWENQGSKIAKLTASQLVHVEITNKLSAPDANALKKLFETCPSTTLIIAEIRDPNDLQNFLRTGRAFAYEIEVSIPDAEQRFEILKLLNNDLLGDNLLQIAAQRTHGYVGDDLSRFLNEIEDLVDDETPSHTTDTTLNMNGTDISQDFVSLSMSDSPRIVTEEHLVRALTHIRPSALQQVFLEKPHVRWSDIGGQELFKARLRNAVEWPIKFPNELKDYGIPPKKGILLYGPPGCSKTMLVKALATESDYNFLAVKGAELISMYVGESERATREVFRKARAASPCIIFFDEIDAIARRGNDSSMLNVLTTLLNEMDGFEELKDVLVVAATNKPQTIDPALMRPGRFDNVVYIGPPDEETRAAIFSEKFKLPKFGDDAKNSLQDFVAQTSGLSGAEVVAVCQLAGELAFSDDHTRSISRVDVLEAIQRTPRSITMQMLEEYENWNAERATG